MKTEEGQLIINPDCYIFTLNYGHPWDHMRCPD